MIVDGLIVRKSEEQGSSVSDTKARKKIIFDFLPKIFIESFFSQTNMQENKNWFFEVKKQKEDDCLFETHLNPILRAILT